MSGKIIFVRSKTGKYRTPKGFKVIPCKQRFSYTKKELKSKKELDKYWENAYTPKGYKVPFRGYVVEQEGFTMTTYDKSYAENCLKKQIQNKIATEK